MSEAKRIPGLKHIRPMTIGQARVFSDIAKNYKKGGEFRVAAGAMYRSLLNRPSSTKQYSTIRKAWDKLTATTSSKSTSSKSTSSKSSGGGRAAGVGSALGRTPKSLLKNKLMPNT